MVADKVRYAAAALAGVTAVIYFLIAARVLHVVEDMGTGITIFGLIAGLGFGLGVVLLLVFKRRAMWTLGALLQIIVIALYFQVGQSRTPHYETWGLVLRIPQVLILGSLAYLSLSRIPGRPKPATVDKRTKETL